jgi:hypothetical protein
LPAHRNARRDRRRRLIVVGVAAGLVLAATVLVVKRTRPSSLANRCIAAGTLGAFTLDLAQAANAATIAAVGKRDGVADHGVTIALAAALQESQLHNVTHGDRDSVGLFQQRPSQGWGSRGQLLVPSYAAAAFYRGLQKVPDWAILSVTAAAQQVQRSAAPHAYAQWERRARTLAEVLTGEVPAGLRCRFAMPAVVITASSLSGVMATELGTPTLGTGLAPPRGWTVANWLVAHAASYRITFVSFARRRWTPASGTWRPDPSSGSQVELGR